jgi:branched-chain amino acid transport system substrate-binding protein
MSFKTTLTALAILCATISSPAYSEFKVGVIAPTTGAVAEYGQALINGIELALSEDSENQINFIFEDAAYDTKLAIQAFQKLTQVDRVNLIYVWGVSFCQALAPLAETYQVAMVGQCLDYKSAVGKKHVVRFMNTSLEQAEVMAKHLLKNPKRKIALIVSDNAYLEEMAQAYETFLGGQISLVEIVMATEQDFKNVLLRLKTRGIDTIGMLLNAGQYAVLSKQLRELNWKPELFGNNFLESTSEVLAAGSGIYGTLIPGNNISNQFMLNYLQTFQHDGQLGFAAMAYEFTKLLTANKNKLNATKSSLEVIDILASTEPRNSSAAGAYEFISSHKYGRYFKFDLIVKAILPNHFVPLINSEATALLVRNSSN